MPEEEESAEVNRVIFDELGHGKVINQSRKAYGEVISKICDEVFKALS